LEKSSQAEETLAAVMRVLDAQFLQHDIRIAKVDADGLWLRQKDQAVLSLASMSDGYRAALAMVVDILRHFVNVYGSGGIEFDAEGNPMIDYTGIVLVDEIDAHLHPSWQRVIGDWFRRVFPKVQFIVTSHSPLICQAADEGGLFHLPPPGSGLEPFRLSPEDYQRVIASRPNEIYVSPAFGLTHTRSPRAVAARETYAKLQAKKRAVALTATERETEKQLKLFVDAQEDDEASPTPAA
jgi:hypothetical protein